MFPELTIIRAGIVGNIKTVSLQVDDHLCLLNVSDCFRYLEAYVFVYGLPSTREK